MGLIQKREEDDRELIEGVEIIEDYLDPDGSGDREDDAADQDDAAVQDDIGSMDAPSVDDGNVAADDAEATGFEDSADDGADADSGEGEDEDIESEAAGSDGSGDGESPVGPASGSNRWIVVACFVIAIVIAAIIGYFVGTGGFGAKGTGSATVAEDQLDVAVASYVSGGAAHTITAREAIESSYSLDAVKNDDGTYAAPSAETVLACARMQILVADAESRGIEVSDDEVADYAETMLGTSDFSSIAESYQVTEDQARDIVRDSCLVDKLYQQVVPEAADLTAPEEPTAPADGSEDTASAEYGAYVIGLLGDEWDGSAGTWARTDGPYFEQLGAESFSADSATYGQALTAYYVALQQYSSASEEASAAWTDYANSLYAPASITIYGLIQ